MQVKGGKAASKTIPKTQKTLKAEVEKSKQKKQDAPYKIPLDKLHSLCYNNIAQKKQPKARSRRSESVSDNQRLFGGAFSPKGRA